MKKPTKNALKLSLIFGAVVMLVCCVGYFFYWQSHKDLLPDVEIEEAVEDEENQDSVSGNEIPTPICVKPEVEIDFTDINKFLFEYAPDELTLDELTWCVNYAIESLGAGDCIYDDSLNVCLESIKQNADDGKIYLVVRYIPEDSTVLVNACTYEDRINPVYQVQLVSVDGAWEIAY